MLIAFGYLLMFASIAFHELGHYYALNKLGVKVKEISLLGFGPKLFSFKNKYFGDTELSIRLFPIGAFVMPNKDDYIEKVSSYKDEAFVSGMGPVASVLFGLFLLSFIHPSFLTIGLFILLLIFHKQATHLVLPIGFVFLGFIVWSIFKMDVVTSDGGSFAALHSMLFKEMSVKWIVKITGVLSIAVGLANGAPMWATDGQHILNKVLENYPNLGFVFRFAGFLLLAYLTIHSIGNDIYMAIKSLI